MKDQMDAIVSGASVTKHSYTVSCSSAFRDSVERLAAKRKVNVGDIARSVLLAIPQGAIAAYPDPGEPEPQDRETVILKSGPAQGRPWRRKPRLQVRMAPGYEIEAIRKALGIALAMEQGSLSVRLEDPTQPAPKPAEPPAAPPPAEPRAADDDAFPHVERRKASRDHSQKLAAQSEELDRLRAIINVLAFEPLPDGVETRAEALHVLGFPPGERPDRRTIRAKFRMLATIHHPDSPHGNHHRMSQLNQAMEVLSEED
jgi:hypothetical protein